MVPCGSCGGTGQREDENATAVLARLDAKLWLSTHQVAEVCRLSKTHAANVLASLHKAGRIERRGSGAGRGGPFEWRRT